MKSLRYFVFLLMSLTLVAFAHADAGSEREAAKLLSTMEIETAFKQSIEQMVEVQISRNPSLLPYRDVMRSFFARYMSYEDLKPEIIRLYADAFTEAELKEINSFYATPTGKKTISLMPELMSQGAEIGSRRIQDNIGELQQMIQAESERLQQQSEAATNQPRELPSVPD